MPKTLNFKKPLPFFSILFSVIIIFITLLPFYLKSKEAPENTYFPFVPNGIILQDYYSDLASIRQGNTVFKEIDPYTTESIPPEYLHSYYLFAGKIGGLFKLSPIIIYYICVYSSLIFLFLFIYLLVSALVPKPFQLLSLFLIYFASPFPPQKVTIFGNTFSIGDGWWTNQNIYNRFFMRPLHLAGVTLLLACSYFFIKFYRKPNILSSITCGVLCFFGLLFSGTPEIIFLAAISIFLLASLIMYLKTKLLIYKNRFLGILAIFIISLPALIILFLQISRSFYGSIVGNWEFVTFQKEIYPVTIGVYLISLGLLLPFILISGYYIIKRKSFESIFTLLLFITPICFYLLSVIGLIHINKMRFMYSAPYVFGSILAAFGVALIFTYLKNRTLKKIAWGFILIIISINTFLGFKNYWWPNLHTKAFYYNVYIPKQYFTLFDYINSSVPKYPRVMTSFAAGNFLPPFTDTKVFVGNEVSTINFSLKYQISQDIYQQKYTLSEVTKIFQDYQIQYLLWEESPAPSKYLPILKKVFQKDNIILYKII